MMRSLISQLPVLLIVSTMLLLFVWAVSRLLGDRMPHLRLVLWIVVLAKLFTPPALLTIWTVEPPWLAALPSEHRVASPVLIEPPGTASVEGRFGSAAIFVRFVGAIWLAGASITLGRWIIARRGQLRRVRISAEDADPAIGEILAEWKNRLKIRRAVRVVVSRDTSIAFTAGIVHPTIYLPAEIEQRLSAEALSTVIAHEVAHVKRLDDLWLAVETVVRSIYFFHPVAWIATAGLRDVREQLTDELVIDSSRLDGRRYGAILLDSISLQAGSATVPGLVESSRRMLERRLVRLGNHQGPRRRKIAWMIGTVLAALLMPAGLDAAADTVTKAEPTLQHPLEGARITSPFGPRRDPFSNAPSLHRGVDFAAARGTLVLAAAPGIVITAAERYEPAPDQGTVVVIRHDDDLRTFSSHLGALLVEEGETVSAGQPIARVGASGRVTGPHLHFEVLRGSDPVDPLTLVIGGGGE